MLLWNFSLICGLMMSNKTKTVRNENRFQIKIANWQTTHLRYTLELIIIAK